MAEKSFYATDLAYHIDRNQILEFERRFARALRALRNYRDDQKILLKSLQATVWALRKFVDHHLPDGVDRTAFYMDLFRVSNCRLPNQTSECTELFNQFDRAASRPQFRGKENHLSRPLFIEDILDSGIAHKCAPENEGRRPNHEAQNLIAHGPLARRYNNWMAVEANVLRHFRYKTLPELFEIHGIYNPPPAFENTTLQEILETAEAYKADPENKGRRPVSGSGPILHGSLKGRGHYATLNQYIPNLFDGAYKSLADLLDKYGIFSESRKLLNLDDIEDSGRAYQHDPENNGKRPGAHSGQIKHGKLADLNLTWRIVYESFLKQINGLKDCGYDKMAEFFDACGIPRQLSPEQMAQFSNNSATSSGTFVPAGPVREL